MCNYGLPNEVHYINYNNIVLACKKNNRNSNLSNKFPQNKYSKLCWMIEILHINKCDINPADCFSIYSVFQWCEEDHYQVSAKYIIPQ